ncbi:hypothetical protein CYY_005534 [Polysphondylium violaceum]|uniref:FNIP repeat-containing protein n=1 Tax=Polysphondylium violaceum TaxID=133409 RepID=A0A8J4PU27_9MYCE|nr:hypothetical protein CYY_005534 [Polysphondylium violaceum]
MNTNQLFFSLWRNKHIRNELSKSVQYRDFTITVPISFFCREYDLLSNLVINLGYQLCVVVDDFTYKQEFLNLVSKSCFIQEMVFTEIGNNVIPVGFIPNGVTRVILLDDFKQPSSIILDDQLFPSTLKTLQNNSHSFDYEFPQHHFNQLKELDLFEYDKTLLPSNLKKLKIDTFNITLGKGVIPLGLKEFHVNQIQGSDVGYRLPESITSIRTRCEKVLNILPSRVESLEYHDNISKRLSQDGQSIQHLAYKIPTSSLNGPVFHSSLQNLVYLSLTFDPHTLDSKFDLTKGFLPEKLQVLKLYSFIGDIHPGGIPPTVSDFDISFLGSLKEIKVFVIPKSVNTLKIQFGSVIKIPKECIPLSVTDLTIGAKPDVLISKKCIPLSVVKLNLMRSQITPELKLKHHTKLKSLTISIQRELKSHLFPSSLTHLHISTTTDLYNFFGLEESLLKHTHQLKDLTLPPMFIKAGSIPKSVTRLKLSIFGIDFGLPKNVIPPGVIDLKLCIYNNDGIPLHYIPSSVKRLRLNCSLQSIIDLPNQLEYIDFGKKYIVQKDILFPSTLKHIRNLPEIQSPDLQWPPHLTTLHFSPACYKTFLSRGYKIPQTVKLVNIK